MVAVERPLRIGGECGSAGSIIPAMMFLLLAVFANPCHGESTHLVKVNRIQESIGADSIGAVSGRTLLDTSSQAASANPCRIILQGEPEILDAMTSEVIITGVCPNNERPDFRGRTCSCVPQDQPELPPSGSEAAGDPESNGDGTYLCGIVQLQVISEEDLTRKSIKVRATCPADTTFLLSPPPNQSCLCIQ